MGVLGLAEPTLGETTLRAALAVFPADPDTWGEHVGWTDDGHLYPNRPWPTPA
jgi:hypothetical protein